MRPELFCLFIERIWLDEKLYSKSEHCNYNIVIELSILNGTVSRQRLKMALSSVFKKYSILRTAIKFNFDSQNLEQEILPFTNGDQFCSFAESQIHNESELETIRISEINGKYFDLEAATLTRLHLVKNLIIRSDTNQLGTDVDLLTPGDVLLISVHHIAYDSWSCYMFLNLLSIAYTMNEIDTGLYNSLQYIDYTIYEKNLIADISSESTMGGAKQFWRQLLQDYVPQGSYDKSISKNSPICAQYSTFEHEFDLDITENILMFCNASGISLFQIGLTFYYVFLFKLTQEKDLCVACLNTNRYRPELESILGMFVNTIPHRFQLDPSQSFVAILSQVRNLVLQILKHSQLLYQEIIRSYREDRFSEGHVPRTITNLLFDFQQDAKSQGLQLGEALLSTLALAVGDPGFDLSCSMRYNGALLSFKFKSSTTIIKAGTSEVLSQRFRILIEQLFDPYLSNFNKEQQPIYELSILLPNEIQILDALIDTSVDFERDHCIKPIHEEFYDRAVEYSQKIAVTSGEQSLTYSELLFRTQILTANLVDQCGVKTGDIVVLITDRSIEQIIGILSIVSAGAIYTPIAVDTPIERLQVLMTIAEPQSILIHSTQMKFFYESLCSRKIFNLQKILGIVNNDAIYETEVYPTVPIYAVSHIVFTSGSTGTPKAVMITHKNLLSYLRSSNLMLNLFRSTDVKIQLVSCTFDAHVEEIFSSLVSGGQLVLVKPNGNLDLDYLTHLINSNQITSISVVPSLINQLSYYLNLHNCRLNTLRCILCGGSY